MASNHTATEGGHGRVIRRHDFCPTRWLPGPHLPTIWASLCRRTAPITLTRERVELADGDFVDLAWGPDSGGPTVVLLHGLEGSDSSSYVRAMLGLLADHGYQGVLMHFRGCSGEPNRLARSYHSGDTGDLSEILEWLSVHRARQPLAVIGYSLGGNVLLKWLGERGPQAGVTTAVAVSVPFDLAACADRLNQGFSRLYQRRLVSSMQQKYANKFADRTSPLGFRQASQFATFWQFDDAVIAPLHGFKDVHDYYQQSSCRQYLKDIDIPTLIIHAEDDPFVPPQAIPQASELAAAVTLELTDKGGHVAFIGRTPASTGSYWLEPRILAHLATHTDGSAEANC